MQRLISSEEANKLAGTVAINDLEAGQSTSVVNGVQVLAAKNGKGVVYYLVGEKPAVDEALNEIAPWTKKKHPLPQYCRANPR